MRELCLISSLCDWVGWPREALNVWYYHESRDMVITELVHMFINRLKEPVWVLHHITPSTALLSSTTWYHDHTLPTPLTTLWYTELINMMSKAKYLQTVSAHCLEQSHQHEVFGKLTTWSWKKIIFWNILFLGSHWVPPCLLQLHYTGARIWSPSSPCSYCPASPCPAPPCPACSQCSSHSFSSSTCSSFSSSPYSCSSSFQCPSTSPSSFDCPYHSPSSFGCPCSSSTCCSSFSSHTPCCSNSSSPSCGTSF